jgi:hypothetical protein
MSCGLPYVYNYFVSGDCSNTGAGVVSFDITGSTAPPYSVMELTTSGLLPTSASTTTYYFSGLTGGSYSLEITDSCLSPGPSSTIINFNISTGSCLSISSTTNTTCGNNNGSLTSTFSVDYGGGEVFLYETTNGYQSSGTTTFGSYTFNSLSGGTYYVIGNDGGGCTGKSESCIVKSSTTVDFGVYVINDGSCVALDGSGKIIVTGQTGTSPYTYSWSSNANGQTGSTVTGLTSGVYSVTMTDSLGCSKTLTNITVNQVLPVGIVNFTIVSPSCFSNDGEVTVQLTGGTSPFYYSGSNGSVAISFSDSYTFTGLSSGNFTVNVTDAGLCTSSQTTTLLTPNGFSILNLNTVNSNCNNSDGQIFIELNGGSNVGTYTYTLINSLGNTVSTSTEGNNYHSPPLSSDTYTILISGGSCVFTATTIINNTNLYTITANTTGTTCGFNNGTIQILASSGGTLPYTYQITGFPPGPVSTFSNLSPGFYDVTVTDSGGCQQMETVYITGSSPVYFDFFATQPISGNDGELDVLITSGEPPFTLNWSSNVNGQTGTTVTGLTAGTYSLEVIDDNGCALIKTINLFGTVLYSSYQTYSVCSNNFQNSGTLGRRGIQQMLNEGFFDLTSGDTNCILNSAIFTLDVTVNGVNSQTVFYTSTGLDDYPTDEEWVNEIKTSLYGFSGITSVETNIETNKIIIKSGCLTGGTTCQPTVTTQLDDTRVIINLLIDYDISCVECGVYQKVFQDDFEFVFQDDNSYIFQGQ